MSRTLKSFDHDLRLLLARAEQLLGEPVRAVELTWTMSHHLMPHVRRVKRTGLLHAPEMLTFSTGRKGHYLSFGVEHYRLTTSKDSIPLIWIEPPSDVDLPDVWAVPTRKYREFYRFLRQASRRALKQIPPVMIPAERQRLWDNTVGYLARDRRYLAGYNVPLKRGVLLLGPPGNGKTMACRWLRYESLRRGFEWKDVTLGDYISAREEGETHDLFRTEGKGIILFDDFDTALRDRRKFGDDLQSTFLGEIDGMGCKSGVVFMFTSNLTSDEIDPAAQRPGRLDVLMTFPPPDHNLRQQLITKRWPSEVLARLNLAEVLAETEGWSFADLEEARKLLILCFLDKQPVMWSRAKDAIDQRNDLTRPRRLLGFSSSIPETATEITGPAAESRIAMARNVDSVNNSECGQVR